MQIPFTQDMPKILAAHIPAERIEHTSDGFYFVTKSMRRILRDCGMDVIIDEEGAEYSVDIYDDWHLTGISCDGTTTYSMVKVREPGDEQGATGTAVPFAALNICGLAEAIRAKNPEEVYRILSRVTNATPDDICETVRQYFADYTSMGSYLIADFTVRKVIRHMFADGNLTWTLEHPLSTYASWTREFLKSLAEDGIYDIASNSITLKNPSAPTHKERCAVLAATTGNANAHSYAGENLWHAEMLKGESSSRLASAVIAVARAQVRKHAVISDASAEGLAVEHIYEKLFKDPESDIYRKLSSIHEDWFR